MTPASWTMHPATFWRRILLVRFRARQLARIELPGSLASLQHLTAVDAAVERT